MQTLPFVVRVYGVYHHPLSGFLISDERVNGMEITKFPGGGLEFGEGTRDCLKREMMEETGFEFNVLDHIYTTDFFVPSAFNGNLQVISIYYKMEPVDAEAFYKTGFSAFDNPPLQVFRWIPADQISPDVFSLVIDQHVGSLLNRRV
jgi:8-oxo-dGTP diphosphatase